MTSNDGSANLSRVDYVYSSTALPVKTYTACNGCPAYLGVNRNWLYTDYETTTIYGSVTASTRVDYTYESTYGNLTTQADQYLSGSTWANYRSTSYYYWPKDTSTRYLVALPGKTKVLDGGGNVLGTTLYLYDGNTGDHQTAPTDGKLTTVRTLMQNGNEYSQVSYTYDDWGNRTSVTSYGDYGAWNASPTTGTLATTYTCYGGGGTLGGTACDDDGYHTYPLWTSNALSQITAWTYDYLLGVPLTETDPNGAETTAEYDGFGRITHLHRPDPITGDAQVYGFIDD